MRRVGRSRGSEIACAVAALVLAAGAVNAAGRFEGGLGLDLGFPSAEFHDHVEGPGVGLDLTGGWRPPRSPAVLGARFGFMVVSSETRRQPFPGVPFVDIRVTTSNNLAYGQAFLRLEGLGGPVRPYVEGLIGFNYLYTESKIESDRDNHEITATKNFDDTVLAYGAGAGLKVRLWEASRGERGRRPKRVLLDTRLDYISGGEADYLRKGSIDVEGESYRYHVTRSRTDLVLLMVGVSVDG